MPCSSLLLTTAAGHPSFENFCRTALCQLKNGDTVYAYLLHDAANCTNHPEIIALIKQGLKVQACAFAIETRKIKDIHPDIILSGLGSLTQLILHTDKFETFGSHEKSSGHSL